MSCDVCVIHNAGFMDDRHLARQYSLFPISKAQGSYYQC
jgi:hypothetical protein